MLTDAERQLILNCARQAMAPDLVRRTRYLLRAPLRWDRILPVAWKHGVASLLYKNVKGVDRENAVPQGARRKLLQLYHRTAYRNLHFFKSLGVVLERFAYAGVKVIVLKGASLSQLIYTDFASRPFLDLDLLIQKDDLRKARELLLKCGYTLPPDLLSESFLRRYHFNLPFVKRDEVRTDLELHWNLTDRFRGYALDMAGFWARAQPATLSNQVAFVLSPEDLLSHLALHLDMHGYLNRVLIGRGDAARVIFHTFSENRLIWFTDLYEVIGHYRGRIDWPALLARSGQGGTDGSVATTLMLLNMLLGPVVDREILKGLEPPRPALVKRTLLKWLMTECAAPEESDSPTRTFIRSKLLAKRKGVQFRLIRFLDLWEYILPSYELVRRRYQVARRGLVGFFYAIDVVKALGHCAGACARLLLYSAKKKWQDFFPARHNAGSIMNSGLIEKPGRKAEVGS